MSARASYRITSNRFPELKGDARRRAVQVVKKTAFDVETDAKALSPVDTGANKNSIQAEEISELHWRVAPGMEYSAYLEFGTSRMAARPYMLPAAESNRDPFIKAISEIADGI